MLIHYTGLNYDDLDAAVTPAPVDTKIAPHGSTVSIVCRTNLEEPVTFTWVRQGALLPRKHTVRGVRTIL
jgi:hypothetical protein